jgi:hypothetical protein
MSDSRRGDLTPTLQARAAECSVIPMQLFRSMLVVLAAAPAAAAAQQPDPLAPVLFLVGRWDGEATSTYGPYRYHNEVVRRGNWLLGTGEAHTDQPGAAPIITTTVMGRDDAGHLVLYLFDAAGMWRFSGTADSSGVTFEWREGGAFRRTRLSREPDGSVRQQTVAHLPDQQPPLPKEVTAESVQRPAP